MGDEAMELSSDRTLCMRSDMAPEAFFVHEFLMESYGGGNVEGKVYESDAKESGYPHGKGNMCRRLVAL
jgi:hypothetical protein